MLKATRWVLVCCLMLSTAAFVSACGSGTAGGGSDTGAQQVVERLLQALEERDVDAFMAVLSPSSVQKLENRVAEMKETLSDELAGMKAELAARGLDVSAWDQYVSTIRERLAAAGLRTDSLDAIDELVAGVDGEFKAGGTDTSSWNGESIALTLVYGGFTDPGKYIQGALLDGYRSLEYDDLVFRTVAGDDLALVAIAGGTGTIVDSRGDVNTEDASVKGPFYYVLEKTDGEWGVDLDHSNIWTPYCST